MINPTVGVDTVYIQAREKIQFLNLFKGLLHPNDWIFQKIESDNDYVNESRITDDLSRTLFHTNYSRGYVYKRNGKFIERPESLLFKFAGLSTYKPYTDQKRKEALNKTTEYLKSIGADMGITELHLAFDVELKTKIEKFLPVKLTKSENITDPFDYYQGDDGSKTLYVESTNNPDIKAYLYHKSKKERLLGKHIYRFEIKFSKLHNISRNPDEIICYIEKNLKSYKLFYFDDRELCDQYKEKYRKNITKKYSKNVPDKLLRDLEKSAQEIELTLSDEIKQFITDIFNQPVKESGSNKAKKPVRYQITSSTQGFQPKIGFNYLFINPLLLKYFYPNLGRGPPKINLNISPNLYVKIGKIQCSGINNNKKQRNLMMKEKETLGGLNAQEIKTRMVNCIRYSEVDCPDGCGFGSEYQAMMYSIVLDIVLTEHLEDYMENWELIDTGDWYQYFETPMREYFGEDTVNVIEDEEGLILFIEKPDDDLEKDVDIVELADDVHVKVEWNWNIKQ